MAKSYAYAVIASHGMYDSGSTVHTVYRTDSLERAKQRAAKLTSEFQASMRKYGGTSGGYRVVRWDSSDKTTQGYDADRMPTVE